LAALPVHAGDGSRAVTGPALLQISDHQTCGFVHERFNRFIPEHFSVVQNRVVGQCLDRGHAHECRKFQVGDAKFIAVALKIGPEQGKIFATKDFHIRQAPGARNLLGEDAMQLGVDAMRLDRHGNNPAHRLLDRQRCNVGQRAANDLHESGGKSIIDSLRGGEPIEI
jgi:hypothetical protein